LGLQGSLQPGRTAVRTEHPAGEKWNVPGASVEYAALARVVAAWPRLRPELKAAVLAVVACGEVAEYARG
jgi:hypothetical protein